MIENIQKEIATHELLVHGSSMDDRFKQPQIIPIVELVREAANRLHHSNTELRKLLESNVAAKLQSKPITSHAHTRTSSEIRTPGPSQLESSTAQSPQQQPPVATLFASPSASRQAKGLPQPPPSGLAVGGHAPLSPVSVQTSIPANAAPNLSVASPSLDGTSPRIRSAHNAHLQDLQHQLSVKTLAHNTLQHEYHILFQRLERQRIKCSTLERKFEVTDAEIISLSNEKDRLEQVVEMMEKQMNDLQKSRDDARKRSSEAASQYLQIVQLASRIHPGAGSVAAEEEEVTPSWLDRETLLKRIEELEMQLDDVSKRDSLSVASQSATAASGMSPNSRAIMLEEEVKQLKIRNAKLEHGLVAAKQAAVTLAAHGHNVGTVLSKALES